MVGGLWGAVWRGFSRPLRDWRFLETHGLAVCVKAPFLELVRLGQGQATTEGPLPADST